MNGLLSGALLLVASLLAGCATIHSGDYGVPLDASNQAQKSAPASDLQISAGEDADMSSPYFGLVEVTFENKSAAWKQIDRITLDFGSPEKNSSIQIPYGEDIDLWESAVTVRNAVQRANTQSALAIIAAVGAAGQVAGHGRGGLAAAGGVLTVGALGALYASHEAGAEQAPAAASFSGAHLLSMPIRIPPGLFTKRWILFYTAARPLGGCISSMILQYDTDQHVQGRVLLRFKTFGSNWQPESCEGRPGTIGNPPE